MKKRADDPRNVRDSLLEAGHTSEEVEAMLGALNPTYAKVIAADRVGSGIQHATERQGNNWWTVELTGVGPPPEWVPEPSLYIREGPIVLISVSPVRNGV